MTTKYFLRKIQVSCLSASLSIAALLVVVGSCTVPISVTGQSTSHQSELTAVERICKKLLGQQLLSKTWYELNPYLKEPNALNELQVLCGGGACGGILQLRNGIEVRFGYPNMPVKGPNGEQDAIVNEIQLWKDGKNLITLHSR